MDVRIGTSGWSYDHWSAVLYRPGLPAARRLDRYAEVFDTVEVNASFYRWPRDSSFAGWAARVPLGFTMSVKAHSGLSHFRRLANAEGWVDRMESGRRALGEHAEAVLVQLRADTARDDARLDTFLGSLPGWIRIAMELRHPSWNHPRVDEILSRHRAAYVVTDGLGLECIPKSTTDFVYLRMHGPDTDPPYEGSYAVDVLRRWADQIADWTQQNRRVLVYFNNDGQGNAVRNACELRELLAC